MKICLNYNPSGIEPLNPMIIEENSKLKLCAIKFTEKASGYFKPH